MITDPRVSESWVMVLLKERYLKNLIQATKMFRAERTVNVRELKTEEEKNTNKLVAKNIQDLFYVTYFAANSPKSANWKGLSSRDSRIGFTRKIIQMV